VGLRLYPNNGGPNGWQFEEEYVTENHPHNNHPDFNRSPTRVSGTPESDAITFGFNRYLYFAVKFVWEPYLAYGVTQRRLLSGELVLEVQRGGEMLRACWDVVDRRTGERLVETATGVISMTADLTPYRESWTMTLHRGDYLLRNGVLEASTKNCGGGS
jgi:hypothetical protein